MPIPRRTLLLIALLLLAALAGVWGYRAWQAQREALADAQARLAAAQAARARPATPPTPPTTTPAAGPAFRYEYRPPQNTDYSELHRLVRESDLFRRLPEIQQVDGAFDLPRALTFRTAECGAENAYYNREDASLTLCYEMLDALHRIGSDQYASAPDRLPENYPMLFLLANVRFILLHEFGHALIQELGLPATGREEDAADQLAVTLMLQNATDAQSSNDLAINLQLAASYFMSNAGRVSEEMLSDVHSLNEQRYYNIQCLLYGSNPGRFLRVVTTGRLPEARALQCQDEAERVVGSWITLLRPHVSPRSSAAVRPSNGRLGGGLLPPPPPSSSAPTAAPRAAPPRRTPDQGRDGNKLDKTIDADADRGGRDLPNNTL